MKTFLQRAVVVLGVLALGAMLSAEAVAGAGDYGPKGKRFGAGIYLGEPTGITFKGYLSHSLAIQGLGAWSFVDKSVLGAVDVTYDFVNIPVNSSTVKLPFYAGVGGWIGSDRGGRDEGRTVAGVRIPVGIAVQFQNHPVEISFEVAPGVAVAPSTRAEVMGGIGVRFYFP